MHLPQKFFKMCRQINDLYTLQLAVQQLAQRHAAAAALIDRHHDLIDPVFLNNLGERLAGRHHM